MLSGDCMKILLPVSKTDIYCKGNEIFISKGNSIYVSLVLFLKHHICPADNLVGSVVGFFRIVSSKALPVRLPALS